MKSFTYNKSLDSERGVSLLELLSVIAIIFIMAAIITINPRPQIDLEQVARQLATNLRRAQNMAMSSMEQGGIVPCGYGIYLTSTTSCVIFYNNLGDCSTDTYEYSVSSSVLETITLQDITVNPWGATSDVYFTPPDPKTYINGSAIGNLTFTLTGSDGSTKMVIVTSAGSIEIQ